jgi:hypothetical protein
MPWLEINFLFWLPGALKSTLTSSLFQGIHTTRKLENTTQYSIGILIANKIFDGNLSLLSYLSGIVVLSVFLLATKVANILFAPKNQIYCPFFIENNFQRNFQSLILLKIPKLYVTFQRNGCEIADINEAIRW